MPRLPSQLTYNDLNGSEAVEILTDWFRQLLLTQPLMQPHLTLPMAKLSLDILVGIDMFVGGTVPVASPPDRLEIKGEVKLFNSLSGSPDGDSLLRATGRDSVLEHREERLSTIVNAAPLPGGVPPDQVREQHGLPVPRPGYGPRDTGSHLFLSDVAEATEVKRSATGGRKGIVADGYVFSSDPATPGRDSTVEQTIDLENGAIVIDMTGHKIRHESGMVVGDDTHRRSVKEFGDNRGPKYSSVNGVYDPGPAGLMSGRREGLGADGRAPISFGNKR